MSHVRWTNEDITPATAGNRAPGLYEDLRTQRGRWAEIEQYPPERIGSAKSRGANNRKRHPDIEYAVRVEDRVNGRKAVLYMRAIEVDD